MKTNLFKRIALGLLCFVFGGGQGVIPLQAAQVRVVADRDTTLFSNGTGESNMGAFTNGIAGSTAVGARARFLVHFPIESFVPAQSTVISARFQWSIIKQNFTAPAATFRWHRMLQPWVEGRGTGDLGSPSMEGEPSWVWRTWGSDRWGAAGGAAGTDFRAEPSGSFLIAEEGRQGWLAEVDENAALWSDVQGWVSGTMANHGWIILGADESVRRTARRVGTHESVPEERPELWVEYEEAQPPVLILKDVRLAQGALEFQFEAGAGRVYLLELSNSLSDGWKELERYPGGEQRIVSARLQVGTLPAAFVRVRSLD